MAHLIDNSARPKNPGLTPLMLSHAARVTHDVEKTADFYTRIMGMELCSTVISDEVPSTGDPFPYFHVFFRMADGSTVAFFEAPGLPERSEGSHPAYDVFDHFAMQVASPAEVDKWHDWLVANNIPVVGPTDHGGLIYSIYFHDPSNLRLEITAHTDPDWNYHTDKAREHLALWIETKRKAEASGESVGAALDALIKRLRKK